MSTSDSIALLSAVFAGAALIVAIIAARIAWLQKRDGKRAATAAERSAKAAEESAEVAARGERAWVMLQEVQSSPDLHADNLSLIALVTLINNGKTPALNVRTWHKVEIRKHPPSESEYPLELTEGSKGSIGPGGNCQLHPAVVRPTSAEYSEIVAHRLTAYVYGVAQYEDLIFKKKDNRTCWCLKYVPETKEYAYADSGSYIE